MFHSCSCCSASNTSNILEHLRILFILLRVLRFQVSEFAFACSPHEHENASMDGVFTSTALVAAPPAASLGLGLDVDCASSESGMVRKLLLMTDADVQALAPGARFAMKHLLSSVRGAMRAFSAALEPGDSDVTVEGLEDALHANPAMFLHFLDWLVLGNNLRLWCGCIEPDRAWTEQSPLTLLLDTARDVVGGDLVEWMLRQSPPVFAQLWLVDGAPESGTRGLGKGKDKGVSSDTSLSLAVTAEAEATAAEGSSLAAPLVAADLRANLHASQVLSQIESLRVKLDDESPAVARCVKSALEASIRAEAWDTQDEAHERWFLRGKTLDEIEEGDEDEDEEEDKDEDNKDCSGASSGRAVAGDKRRRSAAAANELA